MHHLATTFAAASMSTLKFLKRRALELLLLVAAVPLIWATIAIAQRPGPGEVPPLRNHDFPDTYISRIHLDLTSPNHYVCLTWTGPHAADQECGPFRSSPGAGWGTNDCNDPVESNCPDSRCTPKGLRKVEGLLDHLKDTPGFRYVTMIDIRRAIGFHSYPSPPSQPASAGCVRLEPRAARLIYDNSIVGVTETLIDGTWTNPNTVARQ